MLHILNYYYAKSKKHVDVEWNLILHSSIFIVLYDACAHDFVLHLELKLKKEDVSVRQFTIYLLESRQWESGVLDDVLYILNFFFRNTNRSIAWSYDGRKYLTPYFFVSMAHV